MNPRTTLILGGLLLVVFGTFVALKLAHAPTAADKARTRDKVIARLDDVDVDRFTDVTLKRSDEEVHFVHSEQAERWQMTKPKNVLADSSRVRDIVLALKNLRRRGGDTKDEKADTFECKDAAALAQYQLDSPPKVVTVTYKPKGSEKETRTVTLEVGGTTADKEGLYVKMPDEPVVFVVNKTALDSLDKKLNEFRQQKLVTITRWDSDRLQLKWPDRELVAEKQDSKWRLVQPIQDRAETNKLEELIGKLGDLKADGDADFIDDAAADPAKYGLHEPRLVAEIRKPGKSDTSFGDDKKKKDKSKEKEKPPLVEKVLIGNPVEDNEDKVYAMLDGQNYVVAVAASVLAELDKQPNDLRSRDLVDVTYSDVDYVAIERAGSTIAVGKKNFDWEIYQPKTLKADSSAINELVRKIDDLQIKEFLDQGDAKEYELEQPAVTVALYQKGLKKDEDDDTKDQDKKKDKDGKGKDEKKEEKAEGPPEPKGEPAQVFFGRRDEDEKLVYVKRSDSPGIFAVSDEGLFDLLNRDYLAYRDKQIVSFFQQDVAKIAIHRDGKTFSVERKQDEKDGFKQDVWRMTEPVDAPADNITITREILFALSPLRATKLVAEGVSDFQPYGLDEPNIRATLTMKADGDKEAKQHVLLVGSAVEGDGGHYARLGDGDLVFTVSQSLVGGLNAELHDHSLLKFTPDKVDGLTLTWPDAKLELANKKSQGKFGKEWSVVGEADFKLDTRKPGDLVSLLSNLTTDRFAQYQGDFTEEHGLENPALLIEIKLEGEQTSKTLRLGAAAEGETRFAATAEKSGPVGLLPEARVKELIAGPKYFAAAEATQPEPTTKDEGKKEEAKPDEKKPEAEKSEPTSPPESKKNETKSEGE